MDREREPIPIITGINLSVYLLSETITKLCPTATQSSVDEIKEKNSIKNTYYKWRNHMITCNNYNFGMGIAFD